MSVFVCQFCLSNVLFKPLVVFNASMPVVQLLSCVLVGVGNRHVQTYDPTSWPEDHGGDQEGNQFWCTAVGSLHRTDPGTLFLINIQDDAHTDHVNILLHVPCNVCVCLGAEEYGTLCRPEQPNQDVAHISTVDGKDNGGVLPTGWQGKRARDGDQCHVWQTHCFSGKESGNTQLL